MPLGEPFGFEKFEAPGLGSLDLVAESRADGQRTSEAVAGSRRAKVIAVYGDAVCEAAQSSTPGTFQRVSPVPLPAIFCTASTSS
jgi:hypothetical protein